MVDDFLKVPGARVFTVTKHKVTYHDVDAAPDLTSEEASAEPEADAETAAADVAENEPISSGNEEPTGAAAADEPPVGDKGAAEDGSGVAGVADGAPSGEAEATSAAVKRVRVRAVTELERVVFLSRERILVLACPGGPRSPGLVKSNHHLTELQKMTFMRRDPTLVTLHYLAPEGVGLEHGAGAEAAVEVPATKRNVYRFLMDEKEAFIRIVRGGLQRFQA